MNAAMLTPELARLLDPRHLRSWPRPSRKHPVAFVFSRCLGNWEHDPPRNEGLLWLAAELFRAGLAESIAIPGTGLDRPADTTTYAGFPVWKRELLALGVPEAAIVAVPGTAEHTRAEGDDFVRFAAARGWREALILMNPHETLRVMLGLLRSFEIFGHRLRATPVTPSATNWSREVFGSQGARRLPRAHHILEEIRRVLAYQAKGDLVSLDELEAYYRNVLGLDPR